jgi:toxin ParE1/3/4
MNPDYRVLPEVAADIFEIWQFIAADDVSAADRVEAEIWSAFAELAKLSEIGHSRPALSSRLIRFWVVRKYLIAYAPEEHPLLIVAVIHGMRSPRVMADILRERE